MPPCCRRRRPRPRLVHGGGGAAVAWPAGLTWGGPDAESRAGGRRSCRAAGAVDHAQAVANGCCEYTYQHVCVAFAQRGRGAVEPPGKRLEARSPPQRPASTPECSTRLCAPAPRRRAGANLHVAGIPTRGEGRSAPARRGEELPRSALRHCAAPPAGIDALELISMPLASPRAPTQPPPRSASTLNAAGLHAAGCNCLRAARGEAPPRRHSNCGCPKPWSH
jgi:hypothetical protein